MTVSRRFYPASSLVPSDALWRKHLQDMQSGAIFGPIFAFLPSHAPTASPPPTERKTAFAVLAPPASRSLRNRKTSENTEHQRKNEIPRRSRREKSRQRQTPPPVHRTHDHPRCKPARPDCVADSSQASDADSYDRLEQQGPVTHVTVGTGLLLASPTIRAK